ncbi:PAB-dependent poly(A)-specific ribonuclease subunit 3 [Diatrype stigma]|uniref:PAB-dependent poly(A)-specific ribonuclease subunit 3 n=1 Tax=Diatrype stigma TaxID=117547 RepID=A0AAN9V6U5_9PEZI
MANTRFGNADRGRQMASPRPKTRDTKDTLCRNVLIYGHCRYEDQGCAFNHDQHKNTSNSTDRPIRTCEEGGGREGVQPGIYSKFDEVKA